MNDMDVFEIRRRNLIELLSSRGAAARICAKTGTAASYLSTLRSGSRRLGDDLARRIESVEGLAFGWLDRMQCQDHMPQHLTTGDRIRAALDALSSQTGRKRGVTWLADEIGISRASVYKWLNKEDAGMDAENLLLVARVLHVSPSWLAGHTESSTQDHPTADVYIQANTLEDLARQLASKPDEDIGRLIQLLLHHRHTMASLG